MTGGNPQGKPTLSRNRFKKDLIINGPAAQEKKEKRNIPLNLQKENITILPMKTLFLHVERNKEVMTISRGSSER